MVWPSWSSLSQSCGLHQLMALPLYSLRLRDFVENACDGSREHFFRSHLDEFSLCQSDGTPFNVCLVWSLVLDVGDFHAVGFQGTGTRVLLRRSPQRRLLFQSVPGTAERAVLHGVPEVCRCCDDHLCEGPSVTEVCSLLHLQVGPARVVCANAFFGFFSCCRCWINTPTLHRQINTMHTSSQKSSASQLWCLSLSSVSVRVCFSSP